MDNNTDKGLIQRISEIPLTRNQYFALTLVLLTAIGSCALLGGEAVRKSIGIKTRPSGITYRCEVLQPQFLEIKLCIGDKLEEINK